MAPGYADLGKGRGPVRALHAAVCADTDGAQIFFSATATDNCDTNVQVIFTPASGSYFGAGTNVFTSVATDTSGNSNSCSFTVTVTEPAVLLGLALDGTNAVLSWPQSCAAYAVDQKGSLDPADGWTAVNTAAAPSGNPFVVSVPLGSDNKFFRLRTR